MNTRVYFLICMQVPFKVVEVGDNIFISQASHGDEPLFRQGPNISWFERLHEVLCFGMAWARYYRTDGHEIFARMYLYVVTIYGDPMPSPIPNSNHIVYSHFSIHEFKMRHFQPPGAALVLDIVCAAFETCKSEMVTVQIQSQVLRA